MTSRIEQIIEEIEEYIDSCNYQPLSKKNIVVNKEEIEELGYPSLQKYLLRKKEAESFPFVLNGSSMEA